MIFSNSSRYFGIKNPYVTEHRSEDRVVFIQSLFLMLGAIAKADGDVCKQEILYQQSLFEQMRLDKEELKIAEHSFSKGARGDYSLSALFKELRLKTRSNLKTAKDLVLKMFEMSTANGHAHADQILLIEQAANHLGLAQAVYMRLYHSFIRKNDTQVKPVKAVNFEYQQACKVLGVRPQSEFRSIRLHYKRLVQRYHPDKLDQSDTALKAKYNKKIIILLDAFNVINEYHSKKRA